MIRKNREAIVQEEVVKYLKLVVKQKLGRMPLFKADLSGMRTTRLQAAAAARHKSHRGWPDIEIWEPMGMYQGLMLELKAENNSPFRIDGTLFKDRHVEEQAAMMELMRERGYSAHFAVGLDEAVNIINWYFDGAVHDSDGGRP